jgi:hypothetical protein
MNEVISKEVVVLYRVEHEYGWRWVHEFLPKNAELVAMIATVAGQTTTVRYCDPGRPASSPNAELFDEIVTAVLGQKLGEGKLASWAPEGGDYRKRRIAQNPANLLGDLYDVASMSMALLALDIDGIVQYLGDTTTEAMAARVVTTLRAADVDELKENAEVCKRLMRALPKRWNFQLCLTGLGAASPKWDFWKDTLIAAFPPED